MKFTTIFSVILFSCFAQNTFASSLLCGQSNSSMPDALYELKNNLASRFGQISKPVFHESTSRNGDKSYIVCVTFDIGS